MVPCLRLGQRTVRTETALQKIFSDMLMAADRGEATALYVRDLSAAFDTVDHDVLLAKLHRMFGVSGSALKWLRSYLTNRSYKSSMLARRRIR
jgi:hypothetical protein